MVSASSSGPLHPRAYEAGRHGRVRHRPPTILHDGPQKRTDGVVDERDLSAVRRAYAAWNEHDLDAFVEECSPEIEMHSYMLRLLPQSKFVGHEGIRRWAVAVREPWREFVVESLGFYPLGDRVLVAVRLHGYLEGGDAPVEARLGHLMSVRDAKIVLFEAFGSVEDAAAAAGVSRDELARHAVGAPDGRPPG